MRSSPRFRAEAPQTATGPQKPTDQEFKRLLFMATGEGLITLPLERPTEHSLQLDLLVVAAILAAIVSKRQAENVSNIKIF